MNDIKPGLYRGENVVITDSRHQLPPHEKVPCLMKDFVSWMDENRAKMEPIVFVAESHRRFVYIHPFLDGNGRVARFLMTTILLQESYLPASIPPIRKLDYCMALENGRKSPDKFSDFIAEMELMTLTDYMRMLNISFDKNTLKRDTSENAKIDESGKALLDRFVSTATKHLHNMGLKESVDAACREVIGNDKAQAIIRKGKMDDYLRSIGKSGIMEYVTEQVKDTSVQKGQYRSRDGGYER